MDTRQSLCMIVSLTILDHLHTHTIEDSVCSVKFQRIREPSEEPDEDDQKD